MVQEKKTEKKQKLKEIGILKWEKIFIREKENDRLSVKDTERSKKIELFLLVIKK